MAMPSRREGGGLVQRGLASADVILTSHTTMLHLSFHQPAHWQAATKRMLMVHASEFPGKSEMSTLACSQDICWQHQQSIMYNV